MMETLDQISSDLISNTQAWTEKYPTDSNGGLWAFTDWID
jgi:hypothetical protein